MISLTNRCTRCAHTGGSPYFQRRKRRGDDVSRSEIGDDDWGVCMMAAASTSRDGVADERLVQAVREGDRSAFADLYMRYSAIAHRFACRLLGSADGAEDLVSEAFAKVLDRLLVGGGPTIAFHSYLLTTIRTTMYKQWAADRLVDRQVEVSDVSLVEDDPLIDRLDADLVIQAFHTLSERWRAVLWHLEVEKRSTAEVGGLLGIQSNAVAALAFRAREALRIAYLQMHVNTEVDDSCQESARHLVAWLCGRLHRATRSRVERHVHDCPKCSIAASELSDLVAQLRRMVPITSC